MMSTLPAISMDGALSFKFGAPLWLIGLALLSFWPAFRGHWSALLLAAPAILVGGALSCLLSTAHDQAHAIPSLLPWTFAPLLLGLISAVLWACRVQPSKAEGR